MVRNLSFKRVKYKGNYLENLISNSPLQHHHQQQQQQQQQQHNNDDDDI